MNDIATVSGVSILVAIAFHWGSVARLRRKHPAEFAGLKDPSALHGDTGLTSWLIADYMFRCRFMFLGDGLLTLLGALWYISMLLAIGLIALEMVR
jgi:hypothetical protein